MTSFKNKLQELCQKNKWDMPCYKHDCTNNNGIIMWNSAVTVKNKTYEVTTYFTSKIKADNYIAEYAWKNMIEYTNNEINLIDDILNDNNRNDNNRNGNNRNNNLNTNDVTDVKTLIVIDLTTINYTKDLYNTNEIHIYGFKFDDDRKLYNIPTALIPYDEIKSKTYIAYLLGKLLGVYHYTKKVHLITKSINLIRLSEIIKNDGIDVIIDNDMATF